MLVQKLSRTAIRQGIHARGLASTLLLTSEKEWLEKSMHDLRKEAKARGLSSSGSKTDIARRLTKASQQAEQNALANAAPIPTSQKASSPQRSFTSSARYNLEQSTHDKFVPRRPATLNIKFPDERKEVEEGPNIPYLPDSYGSQQEYSASPTQIPPEFKPRVLTVASASTHVDGGPSHSMYESSDAHVQELEQETRDVTGSTSKTSVWADVIGDLGWPKFAAPRGFATSPVQPPKSGKAVEGVLSEITSGSQFSAPEVKAVEEEEATTDRKLDDKERKGLYVLAGIFGGGWLVGKVFS